MSETCGIHATDSVLNESCPWCRLIRAEAEVERLRAERDEARKAARWMYKFVEESEWTHFDEDDTLVLEQWPWLEVTNE